MITLINNNETPNLQQIHINHKIFCEYLWLEIQEYQTQRRFTDLTYSAVKELAELCEVSEGTFYKWFSQFENNGCKLGAKDLVIIAYKIGKPDILNIYNKQMGLA